MIDERSKLLVGIGVDLSSATELVSPEADISTDGKNGSPEKSLLVQDENDEKEKKRCGCDSCPS